MEHLGFVHVIVFFIIYFRTGSNVPWISNDSPSTMRRP
jgi:hypothetical protein